MQSRNKIISLKFVIRQVQHCYSHTHYSCNTEVFFCFFFFFFFFFLNGVKIFFFKYGFAVVNRCLRISSPKKRTTGSLAIGQVNEAMSVWLETGSVLKPMPLALLPLGFRYADIIHSEFAFACLGPSQVSKDKDYLDSISLFVPFVLQSTARVCYLKEIASST